RRVRDRPSRDRGSELWDRRAPPDQGLPRAEACREDCPPVPTIVTAPETPCRARTMRPQAAHDTSCSVPPPVPAAIAVVRTAPTAPRGHRTRPPASPTPSLPPTPPRLPRTSGRARDHESRRAVA